jgi:phytoene synthase
VNALPRTPPPGTADAYAHCTAVTRTSAANFYYGIRLLERSRRDAMCAVYAFARGVDDIGDGTLPREEKLRRLDARARALVQSGAGGHDPAEGNDPADTRDPVMVALADVCARFPLSRETLAELIEGVRMDVVGVSYESFEELVPYCRHVAGSIGRACLAIFGQRDSGGGSGGASPGSGGAGGATANGREPEALADDLGVAMQLTNILRDVREDAENGRVYLPAEDLWRLGLIAPGGERDARATAATLAALARDAGSQDAVRLHALMRFEADRARQWFRRGLTLAPLLERRSAACVLAMAGIYQRLLEHIEADPAGALRARASLPAHEKGWVAVRSMLGAAR